MRGRFHAAVPTALALALVLAAACGGAPAAAPRSRPVALVLPAVDGGDIDLAALRGRIVIVHVFTTWSLEATGDVPQLIEAAARAADVVVVGLALDPEGYQVIAPWRRALDVGYLVAVADPAVRAGDSPLGPLQAVPATLVLDRDGTIVRHIARALAADELTRVIDELLATR